MGISFEAPLALLLLIPALVITIGLHLAARRRMGANRRRVALVVRSALLAALVLAVAGFQLVLPVDRLATVFVVDLSDSVGNPGRTDALAFLRETLKEKPEGDVAGIVAFGKEALVERLPSELTDIDRIASAPVKSATDIGAALRLASALFPDEAQKRIVLLSATATTPPAAGRPRRRWPPPRRPDRDPAHRPRRRGGGHRRAPAHAVHRARRRGDPGDGRRSARPWPSRRRCACSATAAQIARQAVQLEAGTHRRSRSTSTPTEAGFHTFRVRGRGRAATRSARTTGPTRTPSSRASRGCWSSPATTRSRAELVAALEGGAPGGRHDGPRGAADRLRRPRHLRLGRPRRRAADPPHRPPDGRPAGLHARPRARAW